MLLNIPSARSSNIEAGDAQKVRARAGRLHEADLGLLTASLEPELRMVSDIAHRKEKKA
jgi:hypothetical protein